MREPRLLSATPDAPWLPKGSTAEIWVGADCSVPEPTIIVRLLLTRRLGDSPAFFVTPSAKGNDLPTVRLGDRLGVRSPDVGLNDLCVTVLGAPVDTACVGYVRNVVPRPDATYPYPAPDAFAPVFEPKRRAEPIAPGRWLTVSTAEHDLAERHWWPIVRHHLSRR